MWRLKTRISWPLSTAAHIKNRIPTSASASAREPPDWGKRMYQILNGNPRQTEHVSHALHPPCNVWERDLNWIRGWLITVAWTHRKNPDTLVAPLSGHVPWWKYVPGMSLTKNVMEWKAECHGAWLSSAAACFRPLVTHHQAAGGHRTFTTFMVGEVATRRHNPQKKKKISPSCD